MNYLKEYKNSSKLAVLTVLKGFFKFFHQRAEIRNNPAYNIQIKRNLKRNNKVLNEDELIMLLKSAYLNYHEYEDNRVNDSKDKLNQWLAARDWALLSILICTGIRPKEISSLYVESINLKERYVQIKGKGDSNYSVRERTIPLTEPAVLSAVEIYLKLRPVSIFPHLFINQRLEPLEISAIRCIIQKFNTQAGIQKNVSITDIRKSFINLCAEKKIDPLVLRQIMGHNSLVTTMKYYLTAEEQYLREIWEKNNILNNFNEKEYEEWII